MELIQHTINWTKGEITEAFITGTFGFLIILCAVLLWKFGNTPYAKSLVLPLLIVGAIPAFSGISGVITNKNRIPVYEKSWQQDKQKFTEEEKERVEGFDNIFKYSYPAAIILVMCGAVLFFVLGSPTWKAISLSMMLMGLLAYFIDYFASERADIYLQHINEALLKQS